MVKKRVIGGDFIIIEIENAIRVKKVVTNIIKQGIIASAKHSFKQVVKDQLILWLHVSQIEVADIGHKGRM